MSNIKIDVTTENLNAIVNKAIMDSLTPAAKDALIKDTINYLLTEKGSYGNYSSPLQDAFRAGIRVELIKTVQKIIRRAAVHCRNETEGDRGMTFTCENCHGECECGHIDCQLLVVLCHSCYESTHPEKVPAC